MSNATKILLVEDDACLAELVRYNLETAGFDVVQACDGKQALLLADHQRPDLVLLDWTIAGLPGIEVCRRLRQQPATMALPIIMLTARAEPADRICGLETGADDFVTKPFSPRELVARVDATVRRLRQTLSGGVLDYAGVRIDTAAHKVTRDGQAIRLSPTDLCLLKHLLENPGRVVSREQLVHAVWADDVWAAQQAIDVHIRRLRKSVSLDGQRPDVIHMVGTSEYVLRAESPQPLKH